MSELRVQCDGASALLVKGLALQTEGCGFSPENPYPQPGRVVCAWKPRARETETGASLQLIV